MKQEKYLNIFTDGSSIIAKRPFLEGKEISIYTRDNFSFASKKLSAEPEKNSVLALAYKKKFFRLN